jgi:hypothetical protein
MTPGNISSYINFKNDGDIECEFDALYIEEDDKSFSWAIPTFNMYFSSTSFEEGKITAHAMTKSFFKYWLEKEKNYHELIIQITRLGFKATDHRNTVNKMLRGKTHRAKFSSKVQSEQTPEYANARKQVMNLEIA